MADISSGLHDRLKKTSAISQLGRGFDIGELNDYSHEISLYLLLKVFRREINNNQNRSKNDLIEMTGNIINEMKLDASLEQIKSLSFLEEIADIGNVEIYYAGDIDPSGFLIYYSLKKKYSDYNIQLFNDFYKEMLKRGGRGYNIKTNQNKNKFVLETILQDFKENEEINVRKKINYLWKNNLRIPQEVITYEVLESELS